MPELTFEDLKEFPFRCANCSQPLPFDILGGLYCGLRCSSEADFVRYATRARLDGRDSNPGVKNAITIRLAKALNGGYERPPIPLATRKQVINRDQGKCQMCGAPTREIDHKDGSDSIALENLQLLCSPCHMAKTMRNFVLLTEESNPAKYREAQRLWKRVMAPAEKRKLCDEVEKWDSMQKDLTRYRRDYSTGQNSLFAQPDLDGYI